MENEKRLIDANALISQFDDSYKGFVMARIIDEQTTVDAVEVVRCKDCKHWKAVLPDCTEHKKFCEIMFGRTEENCFCSFGERRTDNG